ncbi:MAG: histidine kinase [Thermoflexibacter sp.]|jgi:sensor histidine kinase YesM|nr:histidine kinase [Thermoflexibacter sp.]
MQSFIQKNRILLIHLSFWCLYFSFFFYQVSSPRRGEEVDLIKSLTIAILHISFILFISYLNYFYLLPRFLVQRNSKKYLLEFFSIFVMIIIIYVHVKRFHADGYTYSKEAHYFYSFRFALQHAFNTFFIVVFVAMLKFLEQWFELEAKKKEIENEKLVSELRFLKAQINPHFLFNTLNNLYYLAFTQSPNTTEVIAKLSQMMRYMIYESNHHKVLLSKEIEYMENYISLEKLRLNEQVPINLEIIGHVSNVQIVPLVLITFLENAFKHGVGNNFAEAWVKVKIEIQDIGGQPTKCIYTVENSKLPTANIIEKSGIGLQNVKRRLELSYPNHYQLHVKNETNYYAVKLALDLN